MAAGAVKEVLPPILDSTSDPPPIFDGPTKLYVAYHCPFAQRTWITRNYKGLQEKIRLVAISLDNRPAWYKEKVYPGNKVPVLEHNNEVKGESLDLIKYIDAHFDGPALLPNDPEKRQFAEELLSYSDTFNAVNFKAFASNGDVEQEIGPAFDKIEDALSKFGDGPFFLGDFSLVDIAYAPFIERFQLFFSEIKKYDITKGRPKLGKWIEGVSNTRVRGRRREAPAACCRLVLPRYVQEKVHVMFHNLQAVEGARERSIEEIPMKIHFPNAFGQHLAIFLNDGDHQIYY